MASQSEVRAFEQDQSEGVPLPSADLNPDLSKAIEQYNPVDMFRTPTSAPVSQIQDTDIIGYVKSAMEATARASSMRFEPYVSPDMKPYQDSIEQIRAVYNDNVKGLETLKAQTEAAAGAKVEGIKGEAEGKIGKTAADQARAQQIADINARLAHDLGPAGNAERVATKTQLFHQLNDKAIVLKDSLQGDLQKLQEEEGINFTEDPARWLMGIFTIPQMSDKIAAKQHEVDTLNNEVAGVFADIQENVAALKDANEYRQKAVPTLTAAQEAAEKNIIAAKSAIDVGDANLALVKQSSEFASMKFAETATLGSQEHAALAASLEDARLKFESSSRAVMKADNDAKAKFIIANLASERQAREQIEDTLRRYEVRFGYTKGTWDYTKYKNSSEEVRNFITGQAMGFTGVTVGNAYSTLRDMQERYGISPGPEFPAAKSSALRNLHEYASQLLDPIKNPEIREIQGKEEKRAYVIRKMNEKYDSFQQNPTADTINNPFYEASPRDVSLHSPEIAQWKGGKLLEPFIKGQVQPDTATVVATLAQGATNIDEAAMMISQYYQLNMKIRNSMRDYPGVGYQLHNDSYHWRDTLPGSPFSKPDFTDLTKSDSVTRMLLKREAMKSLIELPSQPF